MNPLLDKDFLRQLDHIEHKEIFAKVIILTFEETPITQIEGKVLSGSININGDSSMRRTCNLSLMTDKFNNNQFKIEINNKFQLFIGVKNIINQKYPDIIWFKQGIYVMTSFNSSLSNTQYNINISGKDKMCLLNGEISGNLPSTTDFGTFSDFSKSIYTPVTFDNKTDFKAHKYYIQMAENEYQLSDTEYNENTTYYKKEYHEEKVKLKIKDIIREAVHKYGKEKYSNIIINDLEKSGLELMEYRGNEPLYLFYNEFTKVYEQLTLNGDYKIPYNNESGSICLKDLSPLEFNNGVNDFSNEETRLKVETTSGVLYSFTKINYGDTVGYRITDLVYAGDLIASIGEPVTSVLDKIKNMLSCFEYFYDIDGHFVFQSMQKYKLKTWNNLYQADGNILAYDLKKDFPYSYIFDNSQLISSISNNPVINNIKNDYSIWGTRKGITGKALPIHLRYAIHEKPLYYKTYPRGEHHHAEIFTTLTEDDFKEKYNTKSFYSKADLPIDFGSEEENHNWWDIIDWANYYEKASGHRPTKELRHYCTGGGRWLLFGDETDGNMDYPSSVPLEQKEQEGLIRVKGVKWPGSTRGWQYYYHRPIYIFDVEKDGSIGYTGHGTYCTHLYSYFLNRAESDLGTSYIYKPELPIELEDNIVLSDDIYHFNVDWRELIYQMAIDYYAHNLDDDFLYQIQQNNIIPKTNNQSFYPTGITGYENFYTDMQGFWRQLYDLEPKKDYYASTGGKYEFKKQFDSINTDHYSESWVWEEYEKNELIFNTDFYLKPDKRLINDINSKIDDEKEQLNSLEPENEEYQKHKNNIEMLKNTLLNFSADNYYWTKNIDQSPELLNFWIDFFNPTDDLNKYNIQNIGDRSKVENNAKVTSIYFRDIPQIVLLKDNEIPPSDQTGYTYINLPDYMKNLFTISTQGKSAVEELNELFHNFSYCVNSINISTLPIYYLKPNTIIHVYNQQNNINGDYNISKITIPLTYNGMMSISAEKIIS